MCACVFVELLVVAMDQSLAIETAVLVQQELFCEITRFIVLIRGASTILDGWLSWALILGHCPLATATLLL